MSKDDSTWLNICYVVFAGLLAYVASCSIDLFADRVQWFERFRDWLPLGSKIVSVVLGIGGALWLRSYAERHQYHLATVAEVRRVTWPSLSDTQRMTMVVVVVVAIFSAILSIFDVICTSLLQTIMV